MPQKKVLTKTEFATKLFQGEFSDLIKDVFYGKSPDLPAVSDVDPAHPKADNPLLALRKATGIGAPSGPMVPLPTPNEELGNKLSSIIKLMSGDLSTAFPEGAAVEALPALAEKFPQVERRVTEGLGLAARDVARGLSPKSNAPMPSEMRMEELLKKFGGTLK